MRSEGKLRRLDRYRLPPLEPAHDFGKRDARYAELLWREAAERGVMGEMIFVRRHVICGNVLANEEYYQTSLRHYRNALAITEEWWAGKGRDAGFVFPKDQVYPVGQGEPMGDVADNTADGLIAAARNVPPEKRDIAIRLLKQLAADEVTTHRKPTPRPDWVEARKDGDGRRRGGKLVADVLAGFIRDKFADELGDGTMSTQRLYHYEGLHSAFYNHRDELPADLRDMPTRSEVNDRMVAEGKVLAERPRSNEMIAYDRARHQVQRARERGRSATLSRRPGSSSSAPNGGGRGEVVC
jgi:hypothetical protein